MDILTPSKLGNVFENYITESIKFYNVYTEGNIRRVYPSITTIDILIIHGNSIFPIQCKYKKNKVSANDIKSFASDVKNIKNILGDNKNYYPIYLDYLIQI